MSKRQDLTPNSRLSLLWGAIVVAVVTGAVAYALLVLLQRRLAFWHPSVRSG